MSKKTIGIIVGSLRKGSFSQSVAEYIAAEAQNDYDVKFIEIGQLPLYSQDYDQESPESYTAFRDEVRSVDAFLFVTPEHNRSVPAALKNALDIGSRPYGSSVWAGKPGAVVSVSPGASGGFGANHHLRQVLAFLDIYTLQQPEMYVGSVMNSLDEEGSVTDASTGEFLKGFVSAFSNWINRF